MSLVSAQANPATVVGDELADNYTVGRLRSLDALRRCVNGADGRRRAQLDVRDGTCGSVQAQVECLMDLATDPALLSKHYAGLATWI